MKTQIAKLQLKPGDIVVVKIPRASKSVFMAFHEQLRKVLPAGQRIIVMENDAKIETLAEMLTPDDLHRLTVAVEQKLLAHPAVKLPQQRLEKAG